MKLLKKKQPRVGSTRSRKNAKFAKLNKNMMKLETENRELKNRLSNAFALLETENRELKNRLSNAFALSDSDNIHPSRIEKYFSESWRKKYL